MIMIIIIIIIIISRVWSGQVGSAENFSDAARIKVSLSDCLAHYSDICTSVL